MNLEEPRYSSSEEAINHWQEVLYSLNQVLRYQVNALN